MPSTNTITVQSPKAARYNDERYAYGYIDNYIVVGPLGLPASRHFSTVEGGQEEYVRSISKGMSIRYANRDAGQYHPHMFMGGYERNHGNTPPIDRKAMVQAIERGEILQEELRDISRVVTPIEATKLTFGSRIRNLLITACTEVEAHCKAILKANGAQGARSMTDYVKLALPLRLSDYRVSCDRFPDYPEFSPFAGWGPNSHSLAWYQAYNEVKHDVLANAHKATLEHAISAVAAADILVLAQWGSHYLDEGGAAPFFGLGDTPTWDAHERNYHPIVEGGWTPVPFKF